MMTTDETPVPQNAEEFKSQFLKHLEALDNRDKQLSEILKVCREDPVFAATVAPHRNKLLEKAEGNPRFTLAVMQQFYPDDTELAAAIKQCKEWAMPDSGRAAELLERWKPLTAGAIELYKTYETADRSMLEHAMMLAGLMPEVAAAIIRGTHIDKKLDFNKDKTEVTITLTPEAFMRLAVENGYNAAIRKFPSAQKLWNDIKKEMNVPSGELAR